MNKADTVEIQVFDFSGNIIYNHKISGQVGENNIFIDLSKTKLKRNNFTILKIKTKKWETTKKLTIK